MLPLTFHPRTHRNRNLRLFHRLPTAGDGQDPPGGHLSTAVPVPPLARPVGKKEQAAPAFLIPACVDPGGRDSLGRGLDAGSIAAVAADPAVQREPDALPQHLSGAYRDPHAAKARLDEMVKRQGWTSTAARVAQDRAQLGDLRGKVGFFAGARAKAERASAERAADSVAPSLECIGAAEARAAQTFRGSPNQLGNAAGRRPRGPGRSHDHQAGATA